MACRFPGGPAIAPAMRALAHCPVARHGKLRRVRPPAYRGRIDCLDHRLRLRRLPYARDRKRFQNRLAAGEKDYPDTLRLHDSLCGNGRLVVSDASLSNRLDCECSLAFLDVSSARNRRLRTRSHESLPQISSLALG